MQSTIDRSNLSSHSSMNRQMADFGLKQTKKPTHTNQQPGHTSARTLYDNFADDRSEYSCLTAGGISNYTNTHSVMTVQPTLP